MVLMTVNNPGVIRVCLAQMGPNDESSSRAAIVSRMVHLFEESLDYHPDLVVFPELALTTYFPKRIRDDYDGFFDASMPNDSVRPLFDLARSTSTAFTFGYAEKTAEGRHFNTMVYVNELGDIEHRYRKLHLPGLSSLAPDGQVRVYEPHYFDHGDFEMSPIETPFGTLGMSLCQDRRYSETYRVLGLKGANIIVTGYNTPASPLALAQNDLSLRAGAYENSLFVVAVAKAGNEDGIHLIGGSCAIDPHGQVVSRASGEGDEVAFAKLQLDEIAVARERWGFYRRRRPDMYSMIVDTIESGEQYQ